MNGGLFEGCKRERSLKNVETQSVELLGTKCSDCCLGVQKAMVSEINWNAVNEAVKKTKNMWLFEGCKRERPLKFVGMQSKELIKRQ
ncbi:Uncharacterized protein APZ42_032258 [Daphnia magna]|uniref:Uncharacterized protein n=1 Tax=Daphnia magna TaxID=35525 RepID=A0A164M501_9CRUS|nr:Uncharacterized protein APZ42_032258 [Daphnia magna]